ncbi:hypothetical protein RHSIM_Rhsim13G0228600 [Rhododendron simsii]|uniref:Beta-glucosidase n=1 Tax=Rhododendron simsii TaxID=118357 RepID=A0A834FZR9_RHOSS|nr:hypothetical protein RHSIM_Rhsim13G0228600 [Rhododendron simsii]
MEAQGNGYANGNHLPIIGNGFPLIHRASFTDDFVFGAASAAFQEDVKIMKKMGLEGFRFSISWSRILPCGQLNLGINKEGIRFYNDLIDELIANGITPFATLFHWDVPQALEDAYGGFLSSKIVADFCDYVDLCFWEFGDRVKHWITLNEPWSFSKCGYVTGTNAPGRGTTAVTPLTSSTEDSTWSFHQSHRSNTSTPSEPFDNGNPATEPYIVTHNLLLAHAAAVDIYRKKYQACQKGKIGITNVVNWMEPYTDSKIDIDAAERALDFMLGWFVDPVVNGRYPQSMRKLVGNRLPEFSDTESEKLKGSYDFLGINYYTAQYVADASQSQVEKLSYVTDPKVKYSSVRNGVPIGPQASCGWIYVDGVRVKGYFVWSLFDNFEWSAGYTNRFGMIYIEFRDGNFTRYPKGSAIWYMNFLNDKDPEALKKQLLVPGK